MVGELIYPLMLPRVTHAGPVCCSLQNYVNSSDDSSDEDNGDDDPLSVCGGSSLHQKSVTAGHLPPAAAGTSAGAGVGASGGGGGGGGSGCNAARNSSDTPDETDDTEDDAGDGGFHALSDSTDEEEEVEGEKGTSAMLARRVVEKELVHAFDLGGGGSDNTRRDTDNAT